MAKLQDGTRVYGSLVVDGPILLGVNSGFSNMTVITTGTSYTLPSVLQYAGAKFKLTIIGRGGFGGITEAATNRVGSSAGSGGVCIAIITVVSGVYSFSYVIDNTSTRVTYNSITYTANKGVDGSTGQTGTGVAGGAGGTASGGILNLNGNPGSPGGVYNVSYPYFPKGGNTPLGYGYGGTATSGSGTDGGNATGYGGGGGGGVTGSIATARSGGSGGAGAIILEY
jgi:hypothetical protein